MKYAPHDPTTAQPERKEQGTTRHHILHLLRRHGEMTATELSHELSIGAVGIRQHLALLERDNLVEITGLRRNIGRPSYLYTLTVKAEDHFPKIYDQLALNVLNHLHDQSGTPAVVDALLAHQQTYTDSYAACLAGKNRAEQVATLADLLNEQGYMCEHQQSSDGSFELLHYNCPLDCVARQHPELCSQELVMYEHLLGVAVQREETIVAGQCCCRYHIPA